MKQIVRRYLTQNPRMLAIRDLKALVDRLHQIHEADFRSEYQAWKEKWKGTIEHRSLHKDGRLHYTHRRLRSAMNSLDFYLPYLFTCQREECWGMPNTNNKIEGTFTDLKKNLNNHSGLTQENRKRFINGFFLGIDRNSKYEKAGTTPIVDHAHTCRFIQSYSSWSCSPAELHYASDCMAKVYKLFEYSE